MAATAKFRVKAGIHIDAEGKRYKKGQIIQSDKDLLKAFPEKFEAVGGLEEHQTDDPVVADGGHTETKRTRRARRGQKQSEDADNESDDKD